MALECHAYGIQINSNFQSLIPRILFRARACEVPRQERFFAKLKSIGARSFVFKTFRVAIDFVNGID